MKKRVLAGLLTTMILLMPAGVQAEETLLDAGEVRVEEATSGISEGNEDVTAWEYQLGTGAEETYVSGIDFLDSGTEKYQSEDQIPEDVSLFGGWIHVRKNYITDLRKVDFDQLLSSYKGHMLLLHGDQDGTVPISWSEEAKEIIPDCEYYVIKDG